MYQLGDADGPVLYRVEYSGGTTMWNVGPSSALEDCGGSSNLSSASNDQPGGGPPTATPYSRGDNGVGGTEWMDGDARGPDGPSGLPGPVCTSDCGIAIAAGGH